MMKTMTEMMIIATCIYDNRSEYDDTPFLYDDKPLEMKDSRNLYYDNRILYHENHDMMMLEIFQRVLK